MTRDPHYEDGPRLIGGAELPRVADTAETGAWCAARGPSVEVERDGEVAVLRNVVICDRPYNHRGNHENRKYDVCWAQKARTYTEGFWRRLEAARKAPPKKVEGWSFVIHGNAGQKGACASSARTLGQPDSTTGNGCITPAPLPPNPDDASWETQDRVWADEAVADRDATSERRAGRVLRGG